MTLQRVGLSGHDDHPVRVLLIGDPARPRLYRLRWIPWLCRSLRRHSAPWLQWVPLFTGTPRYWSERYGASAPATS
jgi:hypothetical protein